MKGSTRSKVPDCDTADSISSSKREESEALAAFHFAMEAGIKSLQKRTEVS
jgi:hypothetical protein